MRTFSVSTSEFPNALPHHLTVGQEFDLTVRCRVLGIQGEVSEILDLGGRQPDGTIEKSRSWVEQTGLEAEFLIVGLEQA